MHTYSRMFICPSFVSDLKPAAVGEEFLRSKIDTSSLGQCASAIAFITIDTDHHQPATHCIAPDIQRLYQPSTMPHSIHSTGYPPPLTVVPDKSVTTYYVVPVLKPKLTVANSKEVQAQFQHSPAIHPSEPCCRWPVYPKHLFPATDQRQCTIQ